MMKRGCAQVSVVIVGCYALGPIAVSVHGGG